MPPLPLFDAVSLTGAEDSVNPSALAALSDEFPFAEWALLAHFEREGEGRNPSQAWRERFLNELDGRGRSALHLCGKIAFERLLDEGPWPELSRYGRIQANINARAADFSPVDTLRVWTILASLGPTLIIQAHDQSERLARAFLSTAAGAGGSILFDESKGRGQTPVEWRESWTDIACGYAGGLGPENLELHLPRIALGAQGAGHWIDMETGLRTENRFDLAKARRVLEISAPWMASPPSLFDA